MPVVNWLSGDLTQRQVGVGWASLRELPMAAAAPSLHVAEVEETLGAIITHVAILGGSPAPAASLFVLSGIIAYLRRP